MWCKYGESNSLPQPGEAHKGGKYTVLRAKLGPRRRGSASSHCERDLKAIRRTVVPIVAAVKVITRLEVSMHGHLSTHGGEMKPPGPVSRQPDLTAILNFKSNPCLLRRIEIDREVSVLRLVFKLMGKCMDQISSSELIEL